MLPVVKAAGRPDLARRLAEEIRQSSLEQLQRGNRAPLVWLALVRAEIALGHREAATKALTDWRLEVGKSPSIHARLSDFSRFAAGLHAQLGRVDDEIAGLRALMDFGFHLGFALRTMPEMESIRDDPRFQEIVRQTEAWARAQPDPIDP